MKKLLTVLLTLVMAICLVNLNNNHIKANENKEVEAPCLIFTDKKDGTPNLYVKVGDDDLEPYNGGKGYSVKVDEANKTVVLTLEDGFNCKVLTLPALQIGIINKNINKIEIEIKGTVNLVYGGDVLVDSGVDRYAPMIINGIADEEYQDTDLVFSGDGILNLKFPIFGLNNKSSNLQTVGILSVNNPIIKKGTSIINIEIEQPQIVLPEEKKKVYLACGIYAWGGFKMEDGEINIHSTAVDTNLVGILTKNFNVSGGKTTIRLLPEKVSDRASLIVGATIRDMGSAQIDISGGTVDILINASANNRSPDFQGNYGINLVRLYALEHDTQLTIKGTGNLIAKVNEIVPVSELDLEAMAVAVDWDAEKSDEYNINRINIENQDTKLSNVTKEDIGKVTYIFIDEGEEIEKPYVTFVEDEKANLDIKIINKLDPKPTPTPTPSPKDESCEKVIGPTWHWNNAKGVCEEYATVGTATR